MRMSFEGKFVIADCKGADPEGVKIPFALERNRKFPHSNSLRVIIDPTGKPINCPRYDKGECISHTFKEPLPKEAEKLLGDGKHIRHVVECTRKRCIAEKLLKEFLEAHKTKS